MSHVRESVGTSSTGSTNAVETSGSNSMSLSLMAWKPRMDEPSKPRPSLIISSSSVAAGIEKCCQVPGRSQNFTSTTFRFFCLIRSRSLPTSLVWATRPGVLVRAVVAIAVSRAVEGWMFPGQPGLAPGAPRREYRDRYWQCQVNCAECARKCNQSRTYQDANC